MQPIVCNSGFIMPADVATRILLNSRVSNSTRKRAFLARSKRIVSLAPVVREGPHVLVYDDDSPSADVKLARKYALRPLAWLLRVGPRCAKLRRRLQKAYEANETPAVREQINAAVGRVETMLDVAAAEIRYRQANVVFNNIEL